MNSHDRKTILKMIEHCDHIQEALIAKMKMRMQNTMNNSKLEPWERISTALGCAVLEPGDDVDAVFRKADQAMYEDKKVIHQATGGGL
jgi:GGDEF domain-containing protein